LEEVARQVMELRRDLTLQVRCECQEVVGVPRLFRRAVLNLAANAARYARQRIEITCAAVGETVQVRMDDDGPGIPPEARQRIFEPFFRLDESRSASSGGTGLGLAIVQRIMVLHGGQVRVEESPLGGARFTLSLPVD
jgi:signal transduction histidine kinase